MSSHGPVAPASDVGSIQHKRLLELDRWSRQSVTFRFNGRLCLKETSDNMTRQDPQCLPLASAWTGVCTYTHSYTRHTYHIHTYKEIFLVDSLNMTFIPSKINSTSVNQAENVVLHWRVTNLNHKRRKVMNWVRWLIWEKSNVLMGTFNRSADFMLTRKNMSLFYSK